MKIMFCLGSMTQGGAERVVSNLSNEFIKKYDVSIVVTKIDKPFYDLDDRINYFTLDSKQTTDNLIKRTIKRICRLRKILKEDKPDIVISLLPEPTFRVMIAKKFLKIKTIISVRNDPRILYNTFLKRICVKLLYSSADGFIFQTPDAKQFFSKKIQKKSIVIPNPINKEFICKPYNKEREKTIVNVARMVNQKNQKLIIDAFYEIQKKYDDYKLKIYGDGPLKKELQKQISNLHMENKVFLMGEVDNIKKSIYKSSIFILASDYEGMPNALMEAMALGIPSISTDCPCGGPKYLIKDKYNGILTKVGNKEELMKAIEILIIDSKYAKKIGDNANKICKYLNPNKINIIWEDYIKKVIG